MKPCLVKQAGFFFGEFLVLSVDERELTMDSKRQVRIFDTTLRDGQQCPGAGMSIENNLLYARLAAKVGVDILEAGFPSASELDFQIVNEIARELAGSPTHTVVGALCQLRSEQIDRTIESLLPAVSTNKAFLHVYLPVDPDLMPASLGEDAEDKPALVKKVYEYVKRAVDAGMQVEFSPEGYSRQRENFDFVTDTIRAAVQAGARTINCPDTIGGACDYQGEQYFVNLMNKHAEIIAREFPQADVCWSTHCHNDYGLAAQNSINAVFKGPARQIEGCFNGIGERAGNAALEQCIMIIKGFAGYVDSENPFYTRIQTQYLQEISDFVSKHMLPRQPHYPINGLNAAKHSSGGHTNAILKNPLVYQPFDPRDVGQEISFLFGPLSGGNHARSIIEQSGYICADEEKAEIAQFIKNFYKERRKGITDDELIKAYLIYRSPVVVEEMDYSRSRNHIELTLTGKFFDQQGELKKTSEGKDSALATLKQAIDEKFMENSIEHYSSESVGSGIHAASRSTIILKVDKNKQYQGVGEDQDIGKSALKALINAVNHAYIDIHYKQANFSKA